MKKGNVVTIEDYSWARTVGARELECVTERRKTYVVIEVGCSFPLSCNQPINYINDTVIQTVDGGKIVFIHGQFLQLATHTLVIDDKTVVLSHESYKNLKEQLV